MLLHYLAKFEKLEYLPNFPTHANNGLELINFMHLRAKQRNRNRKWSNEKSYVIAI